MAPTAADPSTPTSLGPEFFRQDMPLDQLRPSPLNPRKHFDAARLAELASSFAGVGVIEPLVARPADGHYEIVCGARRARAALLAHLETVPVIVKPLTDAQALEVMVIENNQREDVNPLEEGDGFSRLLKSGYALDRLAERLGRSKKYVYDRIKLLDLVPTAKQLLLAEKMSAGHAILLARLKPEDQERAIDLTDGGAFEGDGGAEDVDPDEVPELVAKALAGKPKSEPVQEYREFKPVSVRELNKWISEHVRFDVTQAAAAAPLDYGETAARVAEASAKPGRGKRVIPITFEHYIQPEARDGEERTYGPRSFKFADGRKHYNWDAARTLLAAVCDHAVLGVVAVGEQYGQAFDVCIARDKCLVHWKSAIETRAKSQKLRDSGQGAKADKNEAARRARESAQERDRAAAERRRDLVELRALNLAVDQVSDLTPDLLRQILLNLLNGNGDVDVNAFNARFKTHVQPWRTAPAAVKGLNGRVLAQALVFALLSQEMSNNDLPAAVKPFGVDVKAIEAAVLRDEKAAAKPAVQTSAPKPPAATKRKKR